MKKFISLFSGSGGFDLGFIKDGWTPILFLDSWGPAINTLVKNHPKVPTLGKNIIEVPDKFFSKYEYIDIIIGGPPCQAFSRLNQNQLFEDGKETENNMNDPRRSLFMEFLRAVSIIQPKAMLIENVSDLATRKLGGSGKDKKTLIKDVIIEEIEKVGYNTECFVINSIDYNVPQKRKRIFFLGIRSDLNINPILPDSVELETSVVDEIKKIKATDPNQRIKNHSDAWIEKAKLIPKGGYYNNLPIEYKKLKEVDSIFIRQAIIQKGHCIKIGNKYYEGKLPNTLETQLYIESGNYKCYKIMPRMGTYFRRSKDDIAHTITRNPLIHPNRNREMTVREKACIQTFPTNYEFCGSVSDQHVLVGNAVPINLGFEFAKHITKVLQLN